MSQMIEKFLASEGMSQDNINEELRRYQMVININNQNANRKIVVSNG